MTGAGDLGHANDPVWWVLEHSRARGSAKLVLVVLAKCADYRKCITFPTIQKLMKLTGLSRRQVFSHLQSLRAGRDIEGLGVLPGCGAGVFHLSRFCSAGSDRGVLFSALRCPHVIAVQGLRKGVRKAAYIREKEGGRVRETALLNEFDWPAARVLRRISTKTGGANGHSKLRGNAVLEHNLAVIARAGL
jgi:hypothetical protein